MNRFYALIALAALAPSAAAQITISEDDIRPFYDGPGSTTSFSADDTPSNTAALQALAGQEGTGQTWDFTGLTYTNEGTFSFTPVEPPVPGSDDPHFEPANLILQSTVEGTTSYSYSILDADEFTSLGVASETDEGLIKLKFVPGNTQPLPYTFGSSWVSESDLVFDPELEGFESSTREESEVVGWGTLVTPAGSAGALMVRSLLINTSTIVIDPFPPIVTVDSSYTVSYQTEGASGAFVSLDVDGAVQSGGYSVNTGGTAAEPPPAADALRLEVGPNPARGPVEVEFTLPQAGRAAVRVYDGLGREVAALANGVRPAGVQALVWDASGVPAGLYFVRVQTDGGAASRRVAVAR